MLKDLAEYTAIKTQNSAVSVEDHKITPRTGMGAGMQTLGSGQSTHLVRHWLDDDTSIPGYVQVQMGDPRGGWKVNFCRRLMKKSKSSISASDSPAHIWGPREVDGSEGL